ncbi:MAG: hypothetical protein AAF618_00795 [Pseudomonadota bacterium]
MVAYSFQKRFAPPILEDTKTGTIRAPRKRHAREGEALQLFTGMRTKHCQKIMGDVKCAFVEPITFEVTDRRLHMVEIGIPRWLLHPHGEDLFARMDGFDDMADMAGFWSQTHGIGRFVGFWIGWKHWHRSELARFLQ